jgi:hypothetical protein
MWQDLARRTLADLPDPRNWVTVAGRPFLRAYVNDGCTTPELIAQLDVLASLSDYPIRYGSDRLVSKLDSRLAATLSYFYSPEAHAMVNWPPSLRWDSDSWYCVTALVDLCLRKSRPAL